MAGAFGINLDDPDVVGTPLEGPVQEGPDRWVVGEHPIPVRTVPQPDGRRQRRHRGRGQHSVDADLTGVVEERPPPPARIRTALLIRHCQRPHDMGRRTNPATDLSAREPPEPGRSPPLRRRAGQPRRAGAGGQHGGQQTGKAAVDLVATQGDRSPAAVWAASDESGLAQGLQVVGERRLGHIGPGRLTLGDRQLPLGGELADQVEPRGVAQREQHLRQLHILQIGMRQLAGGRGRGSGQISSTFLEQSR